jgi:biopolymer transport protein ExbD
MNLGQRNKVDAQGSMSSMTDLVFLLLVFFIILSTRVVNGEEVNLPQTNGSPEQLGITVTITKDLRYQVDGKDIDKEIVESRLDALFLNIAEDKRFITLNVDRDVPTGETIELLGMAKENEWQVVVATKSKTP